MKVIDSKSISILSEELAAQIKDFRLRQAMQHAGYPDPAVGYPPMADDWGLFPQAHATRSRVYYGNDSYSYNHHATIAKFKDQYVVAWSASMKHEDHPGQHVRYACSSDGLHWELDKVLAPSDPRTMVVRNNVGLFASDTTLYALVGVCDTKGNRQLGMCSMEAERMYLDVYATQDLENWEHHERVSNTIYLFEGPRPVREGRLLCGGCAVNDWNQGLLMVWDNATDPTTEPRLVKIPQAGSLEPLQATWYQTDDGRIWMFYRDGAFSCRLALSFSDDGGDTWSQPLLTDFPNTCSRPFAGRLTDGRYYIAGNNYDRLLDRRSMLLALSDDGTQFDRMVTVVSGNPTRRIEGKHKEDGYHYPNCLADGDKLFVAYSYNKEDIEVAVVDTASMP